jgi:adenosine deaminase
MVDEGLAELHTHLGGSVASEITWSLAHEQGIALPTRDYWEFDRMVTVSDPRGVPDLDSLDRIYHLTELIQSSPLAVERSVHAAIGGAYRSQRITTLELRFNPMKRNRGGERDLDHIILAAIRGLDIASLEYPQVRAGLLLMMDRTFSADQNMVIVEKAIRYAAASTSQARARAASATTTRRSGSTWSSPATQGSASPSTSARKAASMASRSSPR